MAESASQQQSPGVQLCSNLKSTKGIILITETVLCLGIVISFAVSMTGELTLAVVALSPTLITVIIYSLELQNTFSFITFSWLDFFRATTSCVTILTAAVWSVSFWRPVGTPQVAGGVFCLLAAPVYGYDAYSTLAVIRTYKGHHSSQTHDAFVASA